MIEEQRSRLQIGAVISYSIPNMRGQVFHGTIIHVGLGLAARNAVWVRCADGANAGKVECVMLDHIKSLETGETGETEIVYPSQIVDKEHTDSANIQKN